MTNSKTARLAPPSFEERESGAPPPQHPSQQSTVQLFRLAPVLRYSVLKIVSVAVLDYSVALSLIAFRGTKNSNEFKFFIRARLKNQSFVIQMDLGQGKTEIMSFSGMQMPFP